MRRRSEEVELRRSILRYHLKRTPHILSIISSATKTTPAKTQTKTTLTATTTTTTETISKTTPETKPMEFEKLPSTSPRFWNPSAPNRKKRNPATMSSGVNNASENPGADVASHGDSPGVTGPLTGNTAVYSTKPTLYPGNAPNFTVHPSPFVGKPEPISGHSGRFAPGVATMRHHPADVTDTWRPFSLASPLAPHLFLPAPSSSPLQTLLASEEYADFADARLRLEGVFYRVGDRRNEALFEDEAGGAGAALFGVAPYFVGLSDEHLLIAHRSSDAGQLELLKMIPLDWVRMEPMRRHALVVRYPNGDRHCYVFDAGATLGHGIRSTWRAWLRYMVDATLRESSDALTTTSTTKATATPFRRRGVGSASIVFCVGRLFAAGVAHRVTRKPVDILLPRALKRSLSESDTLFLEMDNGSGWRGGALEGEESLPPLWTASTGDLPTLAPTPISWEIADLAPYPADCSCQTLRKRNRPCLCDPSKCRIQSLVEDFRRSFADLYFLPVGVHEPFRATKCSCGGRHGCTRLSCARILHADWLLSAGADPVAMEMTLIDRDFLIRVRPEEIVNYFVDQRASPTASWFVKRRHSPNLLLLLDHFERVVHLVATETLRRRSPRAQAEVVAKWLRVAARCLHFRNFQSAFAISAGLRILPVFRLQTVWRLVREEHPEAFETLDVLVRVTDEADNFVAYRRKLAEEEKMDGCGGEVKPRLEFIAPHLFRGFYTYHRQRQSTAADTVGHFDDSVEAVADLVLRLTIESVLRAEEREKLALLCVAETRSRGKWGSVCPPLRPRRQLGLEAAGWAKGGVEAALPCIRLLRQDKDEFVARQRTKMEIEEEERVEELQRQTETVHSAVNKLAGCGAAGVELALLKAQCAALGFKFLSEPDLRSRLLRTPVNEESDNILISYLHEPVFPSGEGFWCGIGAWDRACGGDWNWE